MITTELSQDAAKLLNELRAHAESDDGDGFWTVYLDNCNHGFSGKKLSGLFGALAKAGLYKELDGYAFGRVKMEGQPHES